MATAWRAAITSAHLFRFFGDANGDGVVDNVDYFSLRSTIGKKAGDTGFLWFLDFNGDGDR